MRRKGRIMRTRTTIVAVAAMVMLAAGPILADDLNPPLWRGEENSTFQTWEFATNDPNVTADTYSNPYGVPEVDVVVGYWLDVWNGHQGMWALTGLLEAEVPNTPPHPLKPKTIWVQLTWSSNPLFPAWVPDVKALADVYNPEVVGTVIDQKTLADGWMHSTWEIILPNNPPVEVLKITGPVVVDELVIDTIPEPATLSLLVLGGLALIRRRRPRRR